MKRTRFTLWTPLAPILTILLIIGITNHRSLIGMKTTPGANHDRHQILGATVQIFMYPSESLEALGVDLQQVDLDDVLSSVNVEYRYELGLGTLVNHDDETILITHDHWGPLDRFGVVQFRNAVGDALLVLDGETFRDLVRYQDGGTMILGRSPGGDRSDYLSALVAVSKAKYNHSITPGELGKNDPIHEGESLVIVRQGRNGSDEVEMMEVSVESIVERWGQMVYKLRNAEGGNIMPGDSGGGLWLGDRLIGNMWKSKHTYRLDLDEFVLEKKWTETSYAAGLPDYGDEVIQRLGSIESMDEMSEQTSGQEF